MTPNEVVWFDQTVDDILVEYGEVSEEELIEEVMRRHRLVVCGLLHERLEVLINRGFVKFAEQ